MTGSPNRSGPSRAALWGWRDAWALFVARIAAANRGRAALWLPVCFGLGSALYFLWPVEPSVAFVFVATVGAGALVAWVGWIAPARDTLWLTRLLLGLFAIAAGSLSAQIGALSRQHVVLTAETKPFRAEAFVETLERGEDGARYTLVGLNPKWEMRQALPDRVRVSARTDDGTIMPGDRVEALMVLRPPPRPVEPGAFDYARQLWFDEIGATGFTLGAPTKVEGTGTAAAMPWRVSLARFRVGLADRITSHFSTPATGALAAALLTGERAAIPEPVLEDLRIAGLAHLLAISGLHMGLVAGILFVGLRFVFALWPRFALTVPIKKVAAASALVGACAYLVLSGASIPSQRAFIMVGVGFVAIMIDRLAISMRLVAWAGFVVVLLQPQSILSAGFHMSFAAVAALVAVYESLRDRPDSPLSRSAYNQTRGGKIAAYLVGLTLTSLVAGLATLPFAAYHFDRISDYGLLANLAAVPLMAFWVMPLGLLSLLAVPLGWEAVPLQAMGWGIDGIVWVAHKVASLPGSEWGVEAAPPIVLALLSAGLVWAVLWRGPIRFASATAFGVALGLWITAPRPDILIADDGSLMAVRSDTGELVYSSLRRNKFTREQWQRHDGDIANALAQPARCDRSGCLFAGPGGSTVLYATDWAALVEDCRTADVIVAPLSVPEELCPDAVVIDKWDIKDRGAHTLARTKEGWRIDWVERHRGNRLWTGVTASR